MGSNNYVRISNIIEKIYINDEIEKYYSFIGNSDVPYPMAIGKKNIYFFVFPEGYLPKNEFSLNKNFLLSLESEKYSKKFFNDLETDDKAKIRNYNFIFNKLDSSYRKDLNKLKDMYEILNRSSRTLSDYEFGKVILNPFYEIISKFKELFIKTTFFSKLKDLRGTIDTELIEMIVMAHQLPSSAHQIALIINAATALVELQQV